MHHRLTKVLITTSAGVSIFPDHGRDGETVTRHADQAVYHAKQSGRNTHVVFRSHSATNRRHDDA